MPPASRELLERADAIVVSAASVWELSIKRKLGKVSEISPIAQDLGAFVAQALATYLLGELPVTTSHAAAAGDLPLHHRDPFDRMLAAQARIESLTVMSPDAAFDPYDVARVWA